MKKTLTALTLAICAIGSSQAAPVQWTVAAGGNDHWYEYVTTNVDWHVARAGALASNFAGMSGYLATLTSAAENMFASLLAGRGGLLAWIGLTDQAVEGVYRWIDGPEGGQVTGFTNWAAGEPNDFLTGEDYVHTNWAGPGVWNDHGLPHFPDQRNGYLVEYNAQVPEPMTLALVASALLAGALTRRRQA